ncbi:uncharacterized protein HD556DRAFT_1436947 [Suillus plorans]|uniref:Uncharacterized protein n=1 Tax=Suillus plorans TaxID=116603 RepID=A0A9P7DWE9_9AGAM|nr:uncharacterized protein HD556DRAFT_1436947 [Suillus plorans]KAG1804770.1 hypothetical protein HD556DRAFT_1436947 [Suillus plorans]
MSGCCNGKDCKGNQGQTSIAGGYGSIYAGPTTTRRRTTDYEPGLLLLRQDPATTILPPRSTSATVTLITSATPVSGADKHRLPGTLQTDLPPDFDTESSMSGYKSWYRWRCSDDAGTPTSMADITYPPFPPVTSRFTRHRHHQGLHTNAWAMDITSRKGGKERDVNKTGQIPHSSILTRQHNALRAPAHCSSSFIAFVQINYQSPLPRANNFYLRWRRFWCIVPSQGTSLFTRL